MQTAELALNKLDKLNERRTSKLLFEKIRNWRAQGGGWSRSSGSSRELPSGHFISELTLLTAELAGAAEFDERMEQLSSRTRKILGCDRCSIFLLEGDVYRGRFNSGNPPDVAKRFLHHRIPIDDPLVARAVFMKRPVVINDAANDPLMNQETARRARIRAIVVAPVLNDDSSPLGFMTAEFNETAATFSPAEYELFEALAGIVGLSIRHHSSKKKSARLESELQSAHQLASLGKFASGLAHDLNNRLTAVVGLADLLILRRRGTPLESDLEELVRAAEATAELSHHLIELADGESEKNSSCDLGFSFRSIESTLRPHVPATIELVVESTVETAFAPISLVNLNRILSNLVVNSAEACKDGGAISVCLRRVESAEGESAEAAGSRLSESRELEIEIRDTGSGIARSEIARIFEVSYSTKPNGTGLGLSIVRSLVEDVGGKLQLDSDVATGTVVRLVLPEILAPQEDVPTSIPAAMLYPARKLNVLVVDDDEAVRRVMERAIKEHGHQTISACNGHDAIAVAALADRAIDVLVTDLAMPDMNGAEVALALKGKQRDLQILFTSGHKLRQSFQDEPLLAGAGFISKPFGVDRFIRELESLALEQSLKH